MSLKNGGRRAKIAVIVGAIFSPMISSGPLIAPSLVILLGSVIPDCGSARGMAPRRKIGTMIIHVIGGGTAA